MKKEETLNVKDKKAQVTIAVALLLFLGAFVVFEGTDQITGHYTEIDTNLEEAQANTTIDAYAITNDTIIDTVTNDTVLDIVTNDTILSTLTNDTVLNAVTNDTVLDIVTNDTVDTVLGTPPPLMIQLLAF